MITIVKKVIVLLLAIFSLAGCTIGPANTPSKAVESYFERYINNDQAIIDELDEYVRNNNELNDQQKKTYTEILKKQYSDLKYEITNEKYEGNTAIVSVKITVYDLYAVQKESDLYLANHADEFRDNDNNIDESKYMDYKLSKMKDTTKTVDYTLEINVSKINNSWQIMQLSNDSLKKIHGVYNYEMMDD